MRHRHVSLTAAVGAFGTVNVLLPPPSHVMLLLPSFLMNLKLTFALRGRNTGRVHVGYAVGCSARAPNAAFQLPSCCESPTTYTFWPHDVVALLTWNVTADW